ncbi:HlyD family type I secretion periplasmic adaptor subunit [Ruegeria sp. HKCCD8929]|uniref:HlyD family type I secretion periplasmic adaptor subunit n=1 Tax=Ruegeria sp. HKCCD8929 TaxID=2683006 RepID=UPI001487CE9A|nr:HlyD family type I secretion periplasmic adaptor subunit [Ruegeria sp. HKCCD8929]
MHKDRTRSHALPNDRTGGWTVFGLIVSVGLLGGLAAWSMKTSIDGAVIAPGMVGLETSRQVVQHLEGGIISEILVQEDERVARGQVLIELDRTQDQAELNAATSQLTTLTVRKARLAAELEQAKFPTANLSSLNGVEDIILAESRLFANRAASAQANTELLQARRKALEAQINGLLSQNLSLGADMELTQEELASITPLQQKGLLPITRVLEVRRNILNIEAGLSGNAAQIESLWSQIAEVDSELSSAEAARREQISADLAEVDQRLRELRERRVTLNDRLQRSRIVAPRDGKILNLAFHTQGGVVAPGQVLLEIVPVEENTVLMANIPVTEIDRVATGQEATVRLTAFNLNEAPELQGKIATVSADTLTDPATNIPYYSAEIAIEAAEFDRLGDLQLVPGMPADVMISTGERRVASYLTRPIYNAYSRTFRDE